MSYSARLLIFAAASAAAHLVAARIAVQTPRHAARSRPAVVRVEVRRPPPPPDPPPPPEVERPPEPKVQPVHRAPSRRQVRQPPSRTARASSTPDTAAPTERPSKGTGTPVFGISMESTSRAGRGPSMAVGNTVQVPPAKRATAPSKVKPLGGNPAPAWEVTKMPLPKGRCTGLYTEQARRAGIEGTVILDLVVGADGVVRRVKVVQRLGHGLTEAAVRAAKACRFTPGERKGTPVPVRVRRFKIRFYLQGR